MSRNHYSGSPSRGGSCNDTVHDCGDSNDDEYYDPIEYFVFCAKCEVVHSVEVSFGSVAWRRLSKFTEENPKQVTMCEKCQQKTVEARRIRELLSKY